MAGPFPISGRAGWLVVILLPALLAASGAASATSCPPPRFVASYEAPVWTVEWLRDGFPPRPLEGVWFWSPWTEGYEPVASSAPVTPSPTVRVGFTDTDGDGNLSRGDRFSIWDRAAALDSLTVVLGDPGQAPASGDRVEVGLANGKRDGGCGNSLLWFLEPIAWPTFAICGGLVFFFVMLVLAVALHLHRPSKPSSQLRRTEE